MKDVFQGGLQQFVLGFIGENNEPGNANLRTISLLTPRHAYPYSSWGDLPLLRAGQIDDPHAAVDARKLRRDSTSRSGASTSIPTSGCDRRRTPSRIKKGAQGRRASFRRLRAIRALAAYVGGYCLSSDDDDRVADHAWEEAYVEDIGRVGFGPADGTSPGERYVRLAVALDHHAAAPTVGHGSADLAKPWKRAFGSRPPAFMRSRSHEKRPRGQRGAQFASGRGGAIVDRLHTCRLRRDFPERRPVQSALIEREIGDSLLLHRADHVRPHAFLGPAIEARVGRVPLAEFDRQIAPGRSGLRDPEDRFQKQAIIASAAAGIALFSRQYGSKGHPKLVGDISVGQASLLIERFARSRRLLP